tara:strand:- start:6 stop:761 length:756 start_codon:yes stop_codon:yes gene_type:complete
MNIITKKVSFNKLKSLLEDKNLIPFNREIKKTHTKNMAESIFECGVLRDPVIGDISSFDKKKKWVLIDGQHLSQAIVQNNYNNNESVLCKIKKYSSKEEVINDISLLNNTQKKWNDENYLKAWYNYGTDNPNWQYYSELYRLNFDVFINLPLGLILSVYTNSKRSFKLGRLNFPNKNFSDKLIIVCNMLKEKFKKPAHTITGLVMWCKSEKNIDFKKLQSRLEVSLRNNEDKNFNGRDDFRDFVNNLYNRV